MAVVVSVRGGAAVENVKRDVARRRAEHHQAALAKGGLVATVTEGTLLQTARDGEDRETLGGRSDPRQVRINTDYY